MFGWIRGWLARKATPALGGSSALTAPIDAYNRQREPTPRELLKELKATAWTCATINASTCASLQPRLYVKTQPDQPEPKCKTRPLGPARQKALTAQVPQLKGMAEGANVKEVTEHPLLDLLEHCNPLQTAFELWEVTSLYLESLGCAYWLLDFNDLDVPQAIWPLPAQNVTPHKEQSSQTAIDKYIYREGNRTYEFKPEEVIPFLYPDPRDPYSKGLSPLRAAYEQVQLHSEFSAFKQAKFKNHAVPSALLSPEEVIGDEERDRLEMLWDQRMRRGGAGRVIVGEAKMNLHLLDQSMGDLALLADIRLTREDIALCFGVPQPYISGQTNLANLKAAKEQHAMVAIRPRLRRRDERLNERLVPLFDSSGRLFLWTDDPVPEDESFKMKRRNSAFQLGYLTINEARRDMDMAPLPGGDILKPPTGGLGMSHEQRQETGTPPLEDGDSDGEAGEAFHG